jgi:hypothetical protein
MGCAIGQSVDVMHAIERSRAPPSTASQACFALHTLGGAHGFVASQ